MAVVVLTNFVVLLVKSIVDQVLEEKEAQMWNFFGKVFADKAMAMDYTDLEDAKILQQKQAVSQNLFMFGNGLGQLVWGLNSLVNATANIVLSLSLTITLFLSDTGNKFVDSPLWILGIGVCVILGGFANFKATQKENAIFEKWCNSTVWFNRAFTFFGNELSVSPERAKDVRIYKQDSAADRAFQKMEERDKEARARVLRMATCPALAAVVVGMGNIVCWVFVVIKACLGAFGAGSIVQYIGALGKFGMGVQDMMFVLVDNEVYCGHLQGLFSYLDIPNHKYEGTLPVEKRAFCDGGDTDYEIEFLNVSFQYPGAEEYSLHNLSLKFKIGERLAVVGKNGSGKTTFIKLLCRLYDPTEGEIRLNGVDIKKYDYDEYLSIFSVVFQDFKLFSFPLGQNVAAAMEYDKEKTAIYISHRLSSCKFCDEIAVFDNGVVVQLGCHEELMKEKDGLYYELWAAQEQYYEKLLFTANRSRT